MDFLKHNYLSAGGPYDYTFNFWNDYLGLSTLVGKNPGKSGARPSPNSITESLKASLGLGDASPSPSASPCPCAAREDGASHSDCCCCCCCSSSSCCPSASSSPPGSLLDLEERFSLFNPFPGPGLLPGPEREGFGGPFGGFDLFGAERKARKAGGGRAKQEPKICVFCRNNGAPEEVYGSHVLKSPDGRVLCPILRAYTCPLCSANGDNAHTIKYCPLSKEQPPQRALKGGRAVGGRRLKIF
ncbi:nanos homolog 1-like [Rhinatrema bivittatum]|uniref:nanos homolog 1-like n=1 Tax=Rhinatrema bivittatum TaxID=194408 RepID=UPI001129AD0B|nr:nanos homolog 1-like [Rhinatrema bivittatum]